jgi:5-methylcytosine-specific restriction endonuclease McrA
MDRTARYADGLTRANVKRCRTELVCPKPACRIGSATSAREVTRLIASERRAATNGVYKGKKWATSRRAVLARDPICKVCDDALSTEVGHIVPLAEGGDPYDPAGLQAICSPCHWEKTAREKATRANIAA